MEEETLDSRVREVMAMGKPEGFPSDTEFYELAQNQPDRALEVIVKHLGGPLLGRLSRLLGTREEAEDCLQETLIRVAADLGSYDPSGSAVGWEFLRAKWAAQKMRQRAAREKHPGSDVLPAKVEPMTGEAKSKCTELASEFYAGLSEPKRQLFDRRFVLGWTHEEIAADSGAKPDAVRKACSRLRGEFRRVLEKHDLWP